MANSILQALYADDFVITGRNALAYYGLTSFDFNVECLENDKLHALDLDLDHLIFARESRPDEIVTGTDGVRYASQAKAIADFMENPYDDSVIDDILDNAEDDDLADFEAYIIREDLHDDGFKQLQVAR